MSSPEGSIEIEVDSDACGSGSKLSDDSGIEDSWNDEGLTMAPLTNDHNQQERGNNNFGDLATKPATNGVSFKSFTPLTPPKDQHMPEYGPMNIYPMASAESELQPRRADTKDANAVPGVCGIENLGNTCFMNAGLQCIFATTSLKELIRNEKSLGAITNPENSQAVIKLVDRFQEMFQKVLRGEFKSLYPVEFHSSLTQVHAIFGDRKQHDCQEFISFLLNGLHDALNRVDPRKRQHFYQDSSRESSPRISNLRLETSSDSENEDQEETRQDVPKRMKMDAVEPEPDYGVECDEKLTEAQAAWRDYLRQNQSVIVDTYQGQFKSMVTCEKCHHVSSTFEPFMHVSVPIPYANEQQIVVHLRYRQRGEISSNNMKTLRYLVTVSKRASVGDVQKQLLKMLSKENKVEEEDVIMAEVSNSCLIRTLVPEMSLTFCKWKQNNHLYAVVCPKFEVANDTHLTSMDDEDMGTEESTQTVLPKEGPMGWHTCGICLEDIFDDNLMVHSVCGGILCKDCLGVTASYYSGQSFPCPVCNATIVEKDYCEVSKSTKKSKRKRKILIPVLMRYATETRGSVQDNVGLRERFCTFGHPSLLLLPAEIGIDEIHREVLKLLPIEAGVEYSVLLTDSQGLSCCRCDTFSDCSGCILEGDECIAFRPGDHLTVQFDDISQQVIDRFSEVTNDSSMASLRDGDIVKLSECFHYFAESEILSEENPWYCPKCRCNQVATKAISISKWPDVLVVHLKRFYFEGQQSAKVTTPISFPLEKFNLDFVCSPEAISKEQCVYDLIGLVCHTGGLTCGHYTAYVKNNSKWYLFNDETTHQVDPGTIDMEKAYMFFYQKAVPDCSFSQSADRLE